MGKGSGKGSKARARLKSLARKRAQKAANKARYQELARIGENSRSFRSRKKAKKKKLLPGISHLQGRCGNIGCRRCNPSGH